jgi:hypothetical protein
MRHALKRESPRYCFEARCRLSANADLTKPQNLVHRLHRRKDRRFAFGGDGGGRVHANARRLKLTPRMASEHVRCWIGWRRKGGLQRPSSWATGTGFLVGRWPPWAKGGECSWNSFSGTSRLLYPVFNVFQRIRVRSQLRTQLQLARGLYVSQVRRSSPPQANAARLRPRQTHYRKLRNLGQE